MNDDFLNIINLALDSAGRALKQISDSVDTKIDKPKATHEIYESMRCLWRVHDLLFSAHPDLKPKALIDGENELKKIKHVIEEIEVLIKNNELSQAMELAIATKNSCITGLAEASLTGILGRISIKKRTSETTSSNDETSAT